MLLQAMMARAKLASVTSKMPGKVKRKSNGSSLSFHSRKFQPWKVKFRPKSLFFVTMPCAFKYRETNPLTFMVLSFC